MYLSLCQAPDRQHFKESSQQLCERGAIISPFYRWVHSSLPENKTYITTTVHYCLLGNSWMIAMTCFQRERLFITKIPNIHVFGSMALDILKDAGWLKGIHWTNYPLHSWQPPAQKLYIIADRVRERQGPLTLPQAAAFQLASLRFATCTCKIHTAAMHRECSRTQPGGRKGQAPFMVKSEKCGPKYP